VVKRAADSSKAPVLLGVFLFALTALHPATAAARRILASCQAQEETHESPPAEFRAALESAETNLSTEKGADFDKKMRASAGGWLRLEVERCTKEYGGTAFGPFTVLLRIGKSGKAEQVLVWPETHIADCLKPKFMSAIYPKPPKPSWWYKLDLRIKLTTPEAGGEQTPPGAQFRRGIVYSRELGVIATAPEGWMLDNKSGVSQGTHAVMYPEGSTWQSAPEVMYVNVSDLDPGETLEEFIAKDVSHFRKEFLGITIEELEPIVLRSGGQALVRSYSGGAYPSYERVAYAVYGTGAATYVLTCRTRDGLDKTAGLFRDMVAGSYPVKLRFEGKTPIVTLLEPETSAISTENVEKGETAAPKDAEAAPPLWRQGGYSYWSRFRPGTYVIFRYSLRSPASDQDMLKMITLKEITPDAVVLEFRESADVPSGTSPQEGLSAAVERSRFEFRAADEAFQKKDLFGGELSLSPAYILEDYDNEKTGEGVEDIDWQGTKLPTEWRKFNFGAPAAPTTVSLWLSDAIPGTVAKIVREMGGAAVFKEEFVLVDYKVIAAEPAEIEQLRAARKPVLVEIPVPSYAAARFPSMDRLRRAFSDLSRGPVFLASKGNYDWFDQMLQVSPFPGIFRDIGSQLAKEKKEAAEELGEQEMAKLRPLVATMGRLAELHTRLAEVVVNYLSKTAAGPPDPVFASSTMEETQKLMNDITQACREYAGEIQKASALNLRFMRQPGGNPGKG
jgi:hypothetical protein